MLDKLNSDNGLDMTKVDDVTKLKRYYQIAAEDVKQFAAENDKSRPQRSYQIILRSRWPYGTGRVESRAQYQNATKP